MREDVDGVCFPTLLRNEPNPGLWKDEVQKYKVERNTIWKVKIGDCVTIKICWRNDHFFLSRMHITEARWQSPLSELYHYIHTTPNMTWCFLCRLITGTCIHRKCELICINHHQHTQQKIETSYTFYKSLPPKSYIYIHMIPQSYLHLMFIWKTEIHAMFIQHASLHMGYHRGCDWLRIWCIFFVGVLATF